MLYRLPLIILVYFFSVTAMAANIEKKSVCTWDPVGKNGPVIAFFSELIPTALSWGLELNFIPYEDENLVAQDLKDGKCDIGIVTAILSRDFVQFAGTLDAIGGITSERKLRKTLAALSSPKASDLMSDNNYEVVASLPVGSMFAFVNDKKIKGIDNFKGKTLAVLNGDIQTKMFAELSGAKPILVNLSNFSEHFNNGTLDIVLMPALAYNTFELYKGLGDKGGILDIRLFYGMLQAVAVKSSFSEGFGVKMRRYIVNKLNTITNMIDNAENQIPKKYWIKTSQETKDELEGFYKNIRLTLKVNEKFDARALSLLWKIRCLASPDREECVMPK
jgi:Solute-binding protein AdeT 1/2